MIGLTQRYTAFTVRRCGSNYAVPTVRCFSVLNSLSSGHSRWSKIKHDKGKEDSNKSKQRSVLAKELMRASQRYGADPNTNSRLALLVTNAKRAGYPKASIELAIARGQGLSATGAALETMTIEAMMPPSIAAVIECQTDCKARTLQEVRDIFKQFDAVSTPTAFMFERKGKIVFEAMEGIIFDIILEQAIEAGALDIEQSEDGKAFVVHTEPSQITAVTEALTAALPLKVESSDIIWDPKKESTVDIDSSDLAEKIGSFVGRLEDTQSVQEVYLNVS